MMRFVLAIAVVACSLAAARPVAAQDQVSLPLRVYYVERQATHFTTGTSWTTRMGPYSTYAKALEIKNYLDDHRVSGTTSYGIAKIKVAINPKIRSANRNIVATKNYQGGTTLTKKGKKVSKPGKTSSKQIP